MIRLMRCFHLCSALVVGFSVSTSLAFQSQGKIQQLAAVNNHGQRKYHQPSTTTLPASKTDSPFESLKRSFASLSSPSSSSSALLNFPTKDEKKSTAPIDAFLSAYNENQIEPLLEQIADDCDFFDYDYYESFQGLEAIERHFRLLLNSRKKSLETQQQSILVDEQIVGGEDDVKQVGITFRLANNLEGDDDTPQRRGLALFELDTENLIRRVDWCIEGTAKGGETSLRILNLASNFMQGNKEEDMMEESKSNGGTRTVENLLPPERFYDAWNRRDMENAMDVFDKMAVYDDTAFETPFTGKDEIKAHFELCAKAFPDTFRFELDDIIQSKDRYLTRWHVENNGSQLQFTRGLSFYQANPSGKITSGIDFVEPGPVKSGSWNLAKDSILANLREEPVRAIPLIAWIAYMYIVFFSNGILPGADALQLEQRTWEEVRDLSLNFFLVSPLLNLPFSPSVNPMLEGVFNLLLSWAAMFAGFFSDERRDKPNIFPTVAAVVGMQFLTSAFLLPYLVLRSSEERTNVKLDELPTAARVCESPLLGLTMGTVGAGSIVWAFVGRFSEYGGLQERWSSFIELLSIDRVGSSFIVDLAIFAVFQFWLIDDDMKRRRVDDFESQDVILSNIGKFIPCFGLAAYLVLRPKFGEAQEQ